MLNTSEGKIGAVYSLYRTHFTPRKNLANGYGVLHFYKIIGKAEILLEGVLIGKKDSFDPAELILQIPAGEGSRKLNVIIQSDEYNYVGVEGAMVIEAKK